MISLLTSKEPHPLTTELQAEFSAKFLILASFKSLPFYALLNRQDFETPGRLGLVQGPLENFCFGANNSTGAIGSASALGGKILGGTNSLSNSHLVSYLFRDTAGGGNGSGAFFSFRDWFGTFQFGLSEEWPRNSSYSPSIACLIPTERESETQAITAIRTLEGSLEYRRALIDDRTQAALSLENEDTVRSSFRMTACRSRNQFGMLSRTPRFFDKSSLPAPTALFPTVGQYSVVTTKVNPTVVAPGIMYFTSRHYMYQSSAGSTVGEVVWGYAARWNPQERTLTWDPPIELYRREPALSG